MARLRLRDEGGFGIVELVVAVVMITVALLALMAAYDQAFFSLHNSTRKSAAATLAETQLELYEALPYASLGLSSSLLATAESSDAYYSTDRATLTPTGTDVTNSSCPSSGTIPAQCEPVQTSVKGSDGLNYRVETFIRTVTQNLVPSGTAQEIAVTVIVRDPNTANTPIVYEATTSFDQGPRATTTT